jgi:hypothetical protein
MPPRNRRDTRESRRSEQKVTPDHLHLIDLTADNITPMLLRWMSVGEKRYTPQMPAMEPQ